jgi:hypothetical protein
LSVIPQPFYLSFRSAAEESAFWGGTTSSAIPQPLYLSFRSEAEESAFGQPQLRPPFRSLSVCHWGPLFVIPQPFYLSFRSEAEESAFALAVALG